MFGDDGLAPGEFALASKNVFADDRFEVVHVVEVNVFELLNVRIHVARHGDVDHEEGTIAASGHDGSNLFAGQNGLGGAGRTHDYVSLNHPGEAFIITNGSPT